MTTDKAQAKFNEALDASGLFDPGYYAASNPDVVAAGFDPLHHFQIFGRFELRHPGPAFNPIWYAERYASDLAAYKPRLDPCAFYLLVGRKHGHLPIPPKDPYLFVSKPAAIALREQAERRKAEDPLYRSKGILIRTYDKDAPRLHFALASIERFCTGFDSVTVVCQDIAAHAVQPVVDRYAFAVLKICPPYPNDYIGQQITKLRSHRFVDEDLIYHMDSDCMFRCETDLSHYLADGMPILQYRTYDELYRQGAFVPWQEPTSRFLRQQVNLEFMCGFPFAYPRELTIDLENWFEKANGYTYDEIEKHIPFVNNFSEYNLMGAFSYLGGSKYHHFQPESTSFDLCMNQHCRADRTRRDFEEGELQGMRALVKAATIGD